MTKEECLEITARAVVAFQELMPCECLPWIYLVTDDEFETKRREVVEKIQSRHEKYDRKTDESVMEYIDGENGDAVIIKRDCFSINEEERFASSVWHELGHCVAIRAEKPELKKFFEENDEDQEIVFGYAFWSEFIAEAISCHVQNENRKRWPDYQPERIRWRKRLFNQLSNSLSKNLDAIFQQPTIHMFSLSCHFAHYLKEDLFELYREKYPKDEDGCYVFEMPGFDSVSFNYLDEMYRILDMLEEQLKKKEFWVVDQEWIKELGKWVFALVNKHQEEYFDELLNELELCC